MLAIHVGIRRDELKPFKRIMDDAFEKRNLLSTMEDRWEDWAAHWGDDQADDDDIIHIVVSTEIPMAVLRFLAGNMMVFLNEISDEDSSFVNKYIIVTDNEDWTAFYHELSYPE